MTEREPVAELHVPFSDEAATATPWSQARDVLEGAEIFWVSTVRPDGSPHVTPLVAVWLDEVLYFCTGETERKARNLAVNPKCVLTTGSNTFREGLDVVSDEALLRRLADAWGAKYDLWHFEVRDGAFHHEHGKAVVYEVVPKVVFAYGRGDAYSATRYLF